MSTGLAPPQKNKIIIIIITTVYLEAVCRIFTWPWNQSAGVIRSMRHGARRPDHLGGHSLGPSDLGVPRGYFLPEIQRNPGRKVPDRVPRRYPGEKPSAYKSPTMCRFSPRPHPVVMLALATFRAVAERLLPSFSVKRIQASHRRSSDECVTSARRLGRTGGGVRGFRGGYASISK